MGAIVAVAAVPVLLGALAAPAGAAPNLRTGFMERFPIESGWEQRFDQAAADRGSLIILWGWWAEVAPSRPQDPRDPADPAYRFEDLDRAVRAVRARGLVPVLRFFRAPGWAEGPNRADWAREGSWKPDPAAVGDFYQAVARRYSGGFHPSPGASPLPRVRHFQAWNEPNLNLFLSPQWEDRTLVAAGHFRRMLNAAHRGVHAVHGDNILITGGTAPYGGDPPGIVNTRPVRFWREVFCLRHRRKLRPKSCVRPARRARMDVMAHHPINTSGPPRQGALHPDDASSADMWKIRRVIRAAERHNRVRPGGRRPIWAPEIWWRSNPPDPNGFPLRRHARHLAEAMYLAWRGGARVVVNFVIRDRQFRTEWFAGQGSGIYHVDGSPKPAARTFRFPLVGDRVSKRRVRVWGLAPRRGSVFVQRKRGNRWRRIQVLRTGRNRVFTGRIRLRGRATLRARSAGEASLPWRQR